MTSAFTKLLLSCCISCCISFGSKRRWKRRPNSPRGLMACAKSLQINPHRLLVKTKRRPGSWSKKGRGRCFARADRPGFRSRVAVSDPLLVAATFIRQPKERERSAQSGASKVDQQRSVHRFSKLRKQAGVRSRNQHACVLDSPRRTKFVETRCDPGPVSLALLSGPPSAPGEAAYLGE